MTYCKHCGADLPPSKKEVRDNEIKFETLECYIENIKLLKGLEFETLKDAIDYFGEDKVFNIQDDMFDFDYYDLTGTISYNEDTKTYMLFGVVDCYYFDMGPILRVEV
jgi:hypothetical protein